MSKPRVIIRMLEDSTVKLDQQLVAAYLATEYWVAGRIYLVGKGQEIGLL